MKAILVSINVQRLAASFPVCEHANDTRSSVVDTAKWSDLRLCAWFHIRYRAKIATLQIRRLQLIWLEVFADILEETLWICVFCTHENISSDILQIVICVDDDMAFLHEGR